MKNRCQTLISALTRLSVFAARCILSEKTFENAKPGVHSRLG